MAYNPNVVSNSAGGITAINRGRLPNPNAQMPGMEDLLSGPTTPVTNPWSSWGKLQNSMSDIGSINRLASYMQDQLDAANTPATFSQALGDLWKGGSYEGQNNAANFLSTVLKRMGVNTGLSKEQLVGLFQNMMAAPGMYNLQDTLGGNISGSPGSTADLMKGPGGYANALARAISSGGNPLAAYSPNVQAAAGNGNDWWRTMNDLYQAQAATKGDDLAQQAYKSALAAMGGLAGYAFAPAAAGWLNGQANQGTATGDPWALWANSIALNAPYNPMSSGSHGWNW